MLGCWGSSTRSLALAALAAASLAVGGGEAFARSHVTVTDDSGRVVERVRITSSGVQITTRGGRGVSVVTDTLGHGPLVVDEGTGMVRFLSDAEVWAQGLDNQSAGFRTIGHMAGFPKPRRLPVHE